MKVDTTGQVIWSHFYSSGHDLISPNVINGGILNPAGIIESPINGDIVIAGRVVGSASLGRGIDGFFLDLDPSTGNANNFNWLGDASPGACDFFTAITPALSPTGGQGYILGGYSDANYTTPANSGGAWLVKVKPSGNIIWDKEYTSFIDSINGGMVGVVERLNTFGHYEYYALGNVSGASVHGAFVYKLDDSGTPYAVSNGGIDEYYYGTAASSPFNPIAIDYNQATGSDDGLHLFIDNNSNHYLLESYFNGITGCNYEYLGNIAAYETGRNFISHWINV